MTDQPGDIAITRTLAHPRERVWKAWTTGEDFSMWFGGAGAEIPLGELDYHARAGEDWSLLLVDDDGLRSNWAGGFLEVDEPGHLVMTISDVPESEARDTITVDLVDDAGGTTMVFTQRAINLPQDLYEVTVTGWNAFFDSLDDYLSSPEGR